MGQIVYVLMAMEGGKKEKEWRPVGVVSSPEVAEQWYSYGGADVDWVPLELDDIKHLQTGEGEPGQKKYKPTFAPSQIDPLGQRAMETAKKLEETNKQLLAIIERMKKQLQKFGVKFPAETPAQPVTSSLFEDEYNEAGGNYGNHVDPDSNS